MDLLLEQFLFPAQIEEELWEEEFIERCFQEMLEEEEEHEWFIPARDLPQTMDQIQDQFNDLVISDSSSLEDLVVRSASHPLSKAQVCVQGWGFLLLVARESPFQWEGACETLPGCAGWVGRMCPHGM